jgi:hypothetical protein
MKGPVSLDPAPAFPAFVVTLELLLILVSDEDVLSMLSFLAMRVPRIIRSI